MDIINQLQALGLEGKRASVYIAALQLGPASVQEIAKKSGFKRPTTSEVLDALVADGLLTVLVEGRTRIFSPESPKVLLSAAREREQKITRLLPDLEALFSSTKVKPRIKFYEGLPGIIQVYEDTLTTKSRELRGILSAQDLYRVPGRKFMDAYVAKRINDGISLRVIRSEQKEIPQLWPASSHEKREVHLAPPNMVFSMTMYLYDDKIALIGTEQEKFGLIIQSHEFFTMQSNLFETLWSVTRVLRPIEKSPR